MASIFDIIKYGNKRLLLKYKDYYDYNTPLFILTNLII